jgi:hypothetical protein
MEHDPRKRCRTLFCTTVDGADALVPVYDGILSVVFDPLTMNIDATYAPEQVRMGLALSKLPNSSPASLEARIPSHRRTRYQPPQQSSSIAPSVNGPMETAS